MERFWCFLAKNFKDILALLGTLGGVVLGWLLNNISRCGRLKIYGQETWKNKLLTAEETITNDLKQIVKYHCSVTLDLYNSSADAKIMRDIQFVFYDEKKEIMRATPINGEFMPREKEEILNIINVPPKTIIKKQLDAWFLDDWSFIPKTKRIYIEYKNDKNILRKLFVQKFDWQEHLEQIKEEIKGDE